MEAGSIDLIYADPPYCTQKDWGEFDDRWESFDVYLAYMEERLRECHRILAETGSFYLHVDPNTSHYLKVMLDGIFGRKNFRNEIVWCYSRPSVSTQKQLTRCHDVILWYSVSCECIFNPNGIRQPYAESSLKRKGYSLTWKDGESEVMRLNDDGKFPEDWFYMVPMRGNYPEFTGYPTQKPVALLDRIIRASSNAGDLVLDPFCGSGTTLAAARQLGRRYIGIDQNPNAIALCEKRLAQTQPALIPA